MITKGCLFENAHTSTLNLKKGASAAGSPVLNAGEGLRPYVASEKALIGSHTSCCLSGASGDTTEGFGVHRSHLHLSLGPVSRGFAQNGQQFNKIGVTSLEG